MSSTVVVMAALACSGMARAESPLSSSSWSASLGNPTLLPLAASQGARNRFSNVRFDLHLDFGWYSAAGIGGRLEFPIAPRGLLENVDDELALSLGAELLFFYAATYTGVGVYPLGTLQWNFFVNSTVSLFPEFGVAFLFGPFRDRYWGTFIAPFVGLGVRFHFSRRNALLVRVTWPNGLQLGVTF